MDMNSYSGYIPKENVDLFADFFGDAFSIINVNTNRDVRMDYLFLKNGEKRRLSRLSKTEASKLVNKITGFRLWRLGSSHTISFHIG